MGRLDQLRKFGPIAPWLAARVEAFDQQQWRLFYDSVERDVKLPSSLASTMPHTIDGVIVAPGCETPDRQVAAIRAWAEWEKIWGEPPWKKRS